MKKRLLERPKNKEAIDDWDDQYGDKYNYDGTYKIVRPQGPRPEDINSQEYYEYELWDATYGDTHDPLTGYPLIKGLDKTLIPNSGETLVHNEIVFEIISMKGPRINKVKITLPK